MNTETQSQEINRQEINRQEQAAAYLSRAIEGTHLHAVELIDEVGIIETARRVSHRQGISKELEASTESRYSQSNWAEDISQAQQLGFRIIWPGHPEWPDKLGSLNNLDEAHFNEVAPTGLWVAGGSLVELVRDAVAIVGTRAATNYGISVTRDLAKDLASDGVTIVSGAALGIDTVAHQTALQEGGATIAVMANGPGVTYPAANKQLFAHIAGSVPDQGAVMQGGVPQGVVVTEYPPQQRPARHRFLTRNRLVAALSDVTVLVEAGWRSGARNTALWASRMARNVAAVPGNVFSASSTGCHDLIRNHEATLVVNAANVRALYQPIGAVDEDSQLEIDWQASPVQKLSHSELRVYDATSPEQGRTAEEISQNAGLTLGLTVHLLVVLERAGLVQRNKNLWQRLQV